MAFPKQKRKCLKLAMNTIAILVVLLVVLSILLVLLSRSGDKYMEVGEEKIEMSGSITICGIKCFKCCHGQDMSCDEYSGLNCGCKLDRENC